MGVSPGEIGCAWKTVVPRTKEFSVIIIGLLLYMIGLSANSQEMLSTLWLYYGNVLCMTVLSAKSQEALSRGSGSRINHIQMSVVLCC